jgi:hypothetical protein
MYNMTVKKMTEQEFKDSLFRALDFEMQTHEQDYLTPLQLYDAGWSHLYSLRAQYNGRGEELFLSLVKEGFFFDSSSWRRL